MNASLKTSGIASILIVVVSTSVASSQSATREELNSKTLQEKTMQLGVFSVSLAVKDIKASKAFYEKLGFKEVGGKLEQNWLILQNDTTTIGLFQGMFEKNILTFCPGWNIDNETLVGFQDVRQLQSKLKQSGLTLTTEADPASTGPASFTLTDPDGNMILFDQHVPKPE